MRPPILVAAIILDTAALVVFGFPLTWAIPGGILAFALTAVVAVAHYEVGARRAQRRWR